MPRDPDFFRDKTIVISGAASGIGRATALIFAAEGANVVCSDIDGDGAARTAEGVRATGAKTGAKAEAVVCDVTDRDQARAMVAVARDAFGGLDFQLNSAGTAIGRGPFHEVTPEAWMRTFDLNVLGTVHCVQAAIPLMLERGGGVILNLSSLSHRRGGAGSSVHYAAAKGAVVSLSMGVAREYASRGIRCMPIAPASVNSNFQKASGASPELLQRYRNEIPMGRFGEPEEIGELALFLCSDACAFMTADTVYVSGGSGWR